MSQSLPIHAPCSARFRSASHETRAPAPYVWGRKRRLPLPVWLHYWQLSIKIHSKARGQVCLPAAMLTRPSVCAPLCDETSEKMKCARTEVSRPLSPPSTWRTTARLRSPCCSVPTTAASAVVSLWHFQTPCVWHGAARGSAPTAEEAESGRLNCLTPSKAFENRSNTALCLYVTQ